METLVKMKNIHTEEVLFLIKESPKRFIEGMEFVNVKRHETDKSSYYIRRDSLMNCK